MIFPTTEDIKYDTRDLLPEDVEARRVAGEWMNTFVSITALVIIVLTVLFTIISVSLSR